MTSSAKKTGIGYGYLLALLGCVMLLTSRIGIDYKFIKGETELVIVSDREIPVPILGLYVSMVATGLGVRFTMPGIVGQVLPTARSVEELGEKLSNGN